MAQYTRREPIKSCAIFLAFLAVPSFAAEWPNWRGPHHNGTTAETNLPAAVDLAKDVRWSVEMPGTSSASPIVAGGRVFVVSNNTDETKVYSLCIDVNSGKILWQKLLADDVTNTARNTMASCSPVTDGKTVFFLSGNGNLYAYDYEGREVWSKILPAEYGKIDPQFGYTSSPLLFQNKLYLPILRAQWENRAELMSSTDKDSYVICLDAGTGKEIWKVHRPSDARGESFDSYASAVPFEVGGDTAIVIQGGDALTAHDVHTGEELWRQIHNPRKGANWRLIPSPVIAGDVVFALQPRAGDAFGIRPAAAAKFMQYEQSTWITESQTSDVPTPAFYDGKVYVVNDSRQTLLCFDPATGKELWSGDLESRTRIWSSPIVGDGKMYCLAEDGQLTIAALEPEFKVLTKVDFGGGIAKSTVAISDGSLYIRTAEKLYRVGG